MYIHTDLDAPLVRTIICTFRGPEGTQCVYKGSLYGNTMHVQRTNPMGHDVHMYKEPILWGTMFTCTEDQSYGTVHIPTCVYSI